MGPEVKSRDWPLRSHPDIEEVWNRIESHAGQKFRTVTDLPFTYAISGASLRPSRAKQNLPKSQFANPLAHVPLSAPGDIGDLRGPSYIFAMDRVTNATLKRCVQEALLLNQVVRSAVRIPATTPTAACSPARFGTEGLHNCVAIAGVCDSHRKGGALEPGARS